MGSIESTNPAVNAAAGDLRCQNICPCSVFKLYQTNQDRRGRLKCVPAAELRPLSVPIFVPQFSTGSYPDHAIQNSLTIPFYRRFDHLPKARGLRCRPDIAAAALMP
jgi:hypothetical protein